MKPTSNVSSFKISGVFALILVALFALHQDFWLRDNPNLIAGLPIGLAYHIAYCLLVSVTLGLFLRARKR